MIFDRLNDRRSVLASGAVLVGGCTAGAATGLSTSAAVQGDDTRQFPMTVLDDRLAAIVAPGTMATVIASGFSWSEGPTWDSKRSMLYFSDIPNNRVHSWDAQNGLGLWRSAAGSVPAPDGVQAGTNGLLYLPEMDALLVCDQSSRSIIRYDLATGADPVPVVRGPQGLPFNSPNDLVRDAAGGMYFTDPPYGLIGNEKSPLGVRNYSGVYYLAPGAQEPQLLDDGINFPNGIGLSPDEQHLYVTVSDYAALRIVRYSKVGQQWVRDEADWYDMMPHKANETPGHTDGIAIAQDGTIFATAPGGVNVLTPDGELLGRLETGNATGNCCFGEDGRTLFVTSNDILLRMPVLAKGIGF